MHSCEAKRPRLRVPKVGTRNCFMIVRASCCAKMPRELNVSATFFFNANSLEFGHIKIVTRTNRGYLQRFPKAYVGPFLAPPRLHPRAPSYDSRFTRCHIARADPLLPQRVTRPTPFVARLFPIRTASPASSGISTSSQGYPNRQAGDA